MKILRPLKTNYLTQPFGANYACVKWTKKGRQVIGTRTGVCPIGSMGLYESMGMKGHNGEDWKAWMKEPLHFSVSARNQKGELVRWFAISKVGGAGGIGVDVYSEDPIEVNGKWQYVKFRHWHLHSTHIKGKVVVSTGDLIGRCGSTGLSSGPHLHFSLKIVNKQGITQNKGNGYIGAIKFPTFTNEFILDTLNREVEKLKLQELLLKIISDIVVGIKKSPDTLSTSFKLLKVVIDRIKFLKVAD